MSRTLFASLSLITLLAGGCATASAPASAPRYVPLPSTMGYAPHIVAHTTSRRLAMNAVERVVMELGPSGVERNGERLVATFADGAGAREMLVVEVREGTLTIDFRTQLKAGGNGWRASDRVCSTYAYAREQRFAGSVVSAMGDARRVAAHLPPVELEHAAPRIAPRTGG